MTETRYGVGWYCLTPAELAEIPPEYREECQSIRLFGGCKPVMCATPKEATDFLQQIVRVNSAGNLRELIGVGNELFVVECEGRPNMADPWENPTRTRYYPSAG